MTDPTRHALIVGASRGLGLGLAETFLRRGWRVTATRRGPAPGLERLGAEGVAVETVDIDDPASVAALHGRLTGQTFDLVFVVAGILIEADRPLHAVSPAVHAQVYLTNAVSPILFAERFADTMAAGGTLAFMSSVLGSVAGNTEGGYENYRASKAALNTLAISFEIRHREEGFGVALLHPGWVRTEMGGEEADIDVETSVTGTADVIEGLLGQKGIVYRDYAGNTLTW